MVGGFYVMINVDDRLLGKVSDKEMYLLLVLATFFGKTFKQSAYPSNNTLMKMTGWKIDKLRIVKNSLIQKGIIVIEERFNGRQQSNIYHIKTDGMLGYYVSIDNDARNEGVGKSNTLGSRKNQLHPQSEKPTTKKHYVERSINKKEELEKHFSFSVESNGQGMYVSKLFGQT